MGFYDDASLIFLAGAEAGKDGKAYSVKPTNGDGDFTFSRGSNLSATRVGADGLIEKGRENLLLQSNNFDTTWILNTTSVTSGQSGYDGSSNAWRVSLNGATQLKAVYQTFTAYSGVSTASFYAKAGSHSIVQFATTGQINVFVSFDLSSGSVGSLSSEIINASAISLTNGWYRIEVAYKAANAGGFVIAAVDSLSAARFEHTSSTGNFYIQDAQLEIGLAATDYIESGASTGKAGLLENEPRFDYSGDCPSLLLEPSRTNLVGQSEYFDSWTKTGGTSVAQNSVISPDGTQNASRITGLSGTGGNDLRYGTSINPASKTYTSSVYLKGSGTLRIQMSNNVDSAGSAIATLTSSWVRYDLTKTFNATAGSLALTLDDSGGTATTYDVFGAQMEEGSYPTSYIPNHSGGSVTRGIDDCSVTGVSSLIGQSQGTIYWEGYIDVSKSSYGYFPRLLTTSSSSSNWMGLLLTQSNQLRAQYNVSGSASVKITHQISTSGNYKIAFAYNDNDFNCFVNGISVGTNTSVSTTIALNDVYLGMENGANLAPTSQDTKQALLFKERLSNADLATLTTI